MYTRINDLGVNGCHISRRKDPYLGWVKGLFKKETMVKGNHMWRLIYVRLINYACDV